MTTSDRDQPLWKRALQRARVASVDPLPPAADPIGLTRAEEQAIQRQHEPVRVVVVAPPGVIRCRVVVPPDGHDCAAAATHRIAWPDGDATPACADCVLRMRQLAESHRTILKVERITGR